MSIVTDLIPKLSEFLAMEELGTALTLTSVAVASFAIFPIYLRILRRFVETRNSFLSLTSKELDKAQRELTKDIQKISAENNADLSSKIAVRKSVFYGGGDLNPLSSLLEKKLLDRSRKEISGWQDALKRSSETLQNEVERLRSRSTTNLTIGLAITGISAMVLLFVLLLPPENIGEKGWVSIAEAYFPRAALVILLQVSSAFFLRLHATNEADLKQNKNELINLDHKIAAVFLATARNDTSSIETYLVQTERNFILEKGQTTAGRGNDVSVQSIVDAIKEIPRSS